MRNKSGPLPKVTKNCPLLITTARYKGSSPSVRHEAIMNFCARDFASFRRATSVIYDMDYAYGDRVVHLYGIHGNFH